MANLPFALPDLLDPVLSWLSDTLPPPLYSFLVNFLSHSFTLMTALFALLGSLLSTDPSQWDVQTILPPLITLLAAYLALMSLYRTATWMLRTSLFFMKWGTILGALMAGSAWCMNNASGNAAGRQGIAASLGGLVLDMINGQGQNAAGGSRSKSQAQASRSRSTSNKRQQKPKAWDSFEKHREWQYQSDDKGNQESGDIQKIVQSIIDAADQTLEDSGWWQMAKGIVSKQFSRDSPPEEHGNTEGNGKRTRNTKSSNSRSK